MLHQNQQHRPQFQEQAQDSWPKLKFLGGLDNLKNTEIEERGWIQFVLVEMQNGKHYQIEFYDPLTLQSDINSRAERGLPFVADPGMIVLNKVNLRNMEIAIKKLSEEGDFGFFTYLKEWDPKRDQEFFEKYYKGVPKSTYQYATINDK